jgi:kojibiose phosphorylase
VAAKAGYNDRAYAYFRESATIDLYATSKKVMSGGSFLGGIHTAACGATWQIIVQGFAGLKVEQDCLTLQPALPTSWTSLGFRVYYRSNLLTLTITRTSVAVESVVGNREALTVQVGPASNVLQPGDEAHFTL